MQISFHIGAHLTDDDQLIKSLLKNSDMLAKRGVAVPGPSKYRGLLAKVLVKLSGARADQDTQEFLLETFIDREDANHLVLGHQSFLGAEKRAIEAGQFYKLARRNTAWQRNLFPDHDVTFFMAMRNPASFIPMLVKNLPPDERADKLAEISPLAARWSNVIQSIRNAVPDSGVVVWCNEDTPYIWADVMRAITGLGPDVEFEGAHDILSQLIVPEGMTRMNAYLASHPPKSDTQMKRVQEAFLEKFAIPEVIEQEIDLPGWTDDLVEEITDYYEEDVEYIATMPGVTLIQP